MPAQLNTEAEACEHHPW